MLPLVFCEVLLRVMEVLIVTGLQSLTAQDMEVDKNVIIVTPEVRSPLGSTTVHDSFRQEAVKFFEGWGRCVTQP